MAQFEKLAVRGIPGCWLSRNLGVVGANTLLSSEGKASLEFRVGLAAFVCLAGVFQWRMAPLLLGRGGSISGGAKIEDGGKQLAIAAWIVMGQYLADYREVTSGPHGLVLHGRCLTRLKHF
jgi:hypothetical protein